MWSPHQADLWQLFCTRTKNLSGVPEWVTASWTLGPLTHNLLDMEESFFGSVDQTLGFGGKFCDPAQVGLVTKWEFSLSMICVTCVLFHWTGENELLCWRCCSWLHSSLCLLGRKYFLSSLKSKLLPRMQNIKVCLFAHSCTRKKHLIHITAMLLQTASFLWLSMWNFSDLSYFSILWSGVWSNEFSSTDKIVLIVTVRTEN